MTAETKDLMKFQNEKEMTTAGKDYFDRIDGLKITSRETYGVMVQLVKESKSFIAAVSDFFKPMKEKTHAAHKAVCDQENLALKHFRQGEVVGKQRMRGWEQIEAKRAQEAEEKARQKADVVAEETSVRPAVAPVQNKAKVESVTFRDNWKGRVVDLKELLKAVLKEQAPIGWIEIDHSELNIFAQSTKGKISVPGVEWYNDKIVSVRR